MLSPWRIVEGKFGHRIGHRETFFHDGREYSKQGVYDLTTLEPSPDARTGLDRQTGVILPPCSFPRRDDDIPGRRWQRTVRRFELVAHEVIRRRIDKPI